jgi:hypothetical protein
MPESMKGMRILTVARLFFLLVVIPLLLISSLVAFSIIRFGGISKTGTMVALDQKAQQEISVRATDLAQNIADFLRERQRDILVATILPATPESAKSFLETKTQELWVKKDGEIVKELYPLYTEMAFIDANGSELIKIVGGKVVPKQGLVNVSNPANTTFKTEDYFLKAKDLGKGEVYFSPVMGWYVDKASFENGKRFEGIIRMATPLFDKQGFTGVLTLALDMRHLARFTDNIIPTQSGYVLKADVATGDFAFLVDSRGNVIAHPADYHIAGLDPNGVPVAPITPANAEEMKGKGFEVLNYTLMGDLDPAMVEVQKEAATGKSGIKTYELGEDSFVAAYAPVPFYTQEYPKPAGFGWVGMTVDIKKFQEQAKIASEKIEKEGQIWLSTIVLILALAMIILFAIAAILARGINRSLATELPPDALKDLDKEDD